MDEAAAHALKFIVSSHRHRQVWGDIRVSGGIKVVPFGLCSGPALYCAVPFSSTEPLNGSALSGLLPVIGPDFDSRCWVPFQSSDRLYVQVC